MKKRRFLAMLLASCMVFSQTAWAQDAGTGQQSVNETVETFEEGVLQEEEQFVQRQQQTFEEEKVTIDTGEIPLEEEAIENEEETNSRKAVSIVQEVHDNANESEAENVIIYVMNENRNWDDYIVLDLKKEVYEAGITFDYENMDVCNSCIYSYDESEEKLHLIFPANKEGQSTINILNKDKTIIKSYHATAQYEEKVIYIDYPYKMNTHLDETATWEFISEDEDVCQGNTELLDSYYFGTVYRQYYINFIGKRTGSTIVKIKRNGVYEYAYRVIVKEKPENIIHFIDNALLEALLRTDGSIDTDEDGYITKEELAKVEWLYLSNAGITDLTGLEYAENLRHIYLYGNTELANVDALLELSKLEMIGISGTKVPAETRMKLAKIESNIVMNKGDWISLINTGSNASIFDEELQVSIEEGTDIISYVDEMILAKESGNASVRVSYQGCSLDVEIQINGIPAEQEIGENSDLDVTKVGENQILSSNGILWQIYPEMTKVKEDVVDYVAGWIYSGKDSVEFAYALDKGGNLWSNEEKIAENVKKFTGHYALDKNGVLTDLYNTNKTEIENVVDIQGSFGGEYDAESGTYIRQVTPYILKNDGTLWSRKEVEKEAITNEFQKIAENVKEIGTDGYLLESGEYFLYYRNGEAYASNMESIPDKDSFEFYLGKDGNSYILYLGNFVNAGAIKIVAAQNYPWNINPFYITEDGKYYEFIEDGNDILVAEDVVEILYPSGIYKTKDGLYHDREGRTGTIDAPIGFFCDWYEDKYVLEDYGVAGDYNLRKNDVLLLTHVKSINGRYAVRTDGTVWDITGVPKMILDLESSTFIIGDVNEDGKVNIEDLRIILRGVCGKIELTSQQIKAADVVADGKVDIQDLRKELRFVCGKIPSLD